MPFPTAHYEFKPPVIRPKPGNDVVAYDQPGVTYDAVNVTYDGHNPTGPP
jgi:hypothetical protein